MTLPPKQIKKSRESNKLFKKISRKLKKSEASKLKLIKQLPFSSEIALRASGKKIRDELVEHIRRTSLATKKEIMDIIHSSSHDIAYKSLQDQAYQNRHNLVLLGLLEHERDSAFTQAVNFCNSQLNLSRLSIDVAYRMGKAPAPDSTYIRPMVVIFYKVADRNLVWAKRNDIRQKRRAKPIRIQADIPKRLREDLQILYIVKNAAMQSNQFQTVEIKNYRLYLDGAEYFAWELEGLPESLRPSTLATRKSNEVMVFYSKYSALSNHHSSPFKVRGRAFANREQYLAYKRAKLSGQKPLIQKALRAYDPVEAKSILNTLRSDHYDKWKKDLPTLALKGLQAKFRQNPALAEYLLTTAHLTLGEASTNSQWGVGMTLEDGNVLNKAKWNKQGNLLGRLLMKVWDQMIRERQTSSPDARTANSNQTQQNNADTSPRMRPTNATGNESNPSNKTSETRHRGK